MRPEEIEQRDFATSLRGFDKNEVRAFLRRIAGDVRDYELDRSGQQSLRDEAEAAVSPVSLTPALVGEDRFEALGDRIANLLRQAHETSGQLRESAQDEAAALREDAQNDRLEAQAEAQRIRDEAAALRVETDEELRQLRERTDAEAVEIRTQAEIDGNAKLDGRMADVQRIETEIAAERETAMAELADARAQVATLLAEARAQSEFIKREGEEIIREKVRTSMDQAQTRIDVLRNTEQSSRDRILTAQRELESALGRLESDPAPGFDDGTEDAVIEEAERRAIETNYGNPVNESSIDGTAIDANAIDANAIDANEFITESGDLADQSAETPPAGSFVEAGFVEPDADVVEADFIEAEVIEAEVIEAPVVEAEVAEAPVVEDGVIEDGIIQDGASGFQAPAVGYETDAIAPEIADAGTFEEAQLPSVPSAPSMPPMPDSLAPRVPAMPDSPEFSAPDSVPAEFEVPSAPAFSDAEASVDQIDGQNLGERFGQADGVTPVFGAPTSNSGPAADFYNKAPAFGDQLDSVSTESRSTDGLLANEAPPAFGEDLGPLATDEPIEDVATPENEDALARLVREAMQRAVESARGSD